ncbi:neoverrucotoxin subunit alpha-like [Pungitius pungitius]|uniref:neoverrucotoxin subunit alpha-like n=1 Tax=Pungitius pungitius TaxID=134920 RepID=UPI0018883449|nr:neoverrucotoxin subunit alpha-like [Pungitius pungitius]
MEGTKIVKNQSELDREVLARDVDDTLCFVFTSTKQGEKSGSTTEDPWFYSDEVFISMRQKAKAFQDYRKAQKNNYRIRFLIAVIPNEKYKGATIYHYKQGRLVSEDFSGPDLHPDPENITDRRDLTWYACDLTLDPNTLNNYLVLSDGNKMATSGSTWHQYPDNPERFNVHTQVFCQEGLSARHYWEVDWDNASATKSIYAAVAHREMKRKGDGKDSEFGKNDQSWAFGQWKNNAQHELRAWHGGYIWQYPFPSDGCSTLGVYLDWPAGTLSFYKVSSHTLTHLHTFHTNFTEPLYPGLWVYNTGNYAYLRPL